MKTLTMEHKRAIASGKTKIHEIYCDIDIPFEKFPKSDEYIQCLEVLPKLQTTGIWIRMSSGGRTHLKVVLKYPVSILKYIQLRAALCDDPQHLQCDLTRMYFFGDDTARQNLVADKKIKQGTLLSAGEWQDFSSFHL